MTKFIVIYNLGTVDHHFICDNQQELEAFLSYCRKSHWRIINTYRAEEIA